MVPTLPASVCCFVAFPWDRLRARRARVFLSDPRELSFGYRLVGGSAFGVNLVGDGPVVPGLLQNIEDFRFHDGQFWIGLEFTGNQRMDARARRVHDAVELRTPSLCSWFRGLFLA